MAAPSKKFSELMLYIAGRCQNDPFFGGTKLNKVLFWSDMYFYAVTGRTITGEEYQRLPYGPAPKRLLPAVDQLTKAGRAAMSERMTQKGPQKRLVALRDADLTCFSADEISMVDKVLSLVDGRSATRLSDDSHDHPGWLFASDRETINPNAMFLSIRPLTESEAAAGRREAETQGLIAV